MGVARYDIADNGTLAYVPRGAFGTFRLVWVDREGNATLAFDEVQRFSSPRIAPDGLRVAAAESTEGNQQHIWSYDITRGTRTRITLEGANGSPVWSRDGERIAFASRRDGSPGLYSKVSDGTGDAQLLTEGALLPSSWSRDVLVYHSRRGSDVRLLSTDGTDAPFLESSFSETAAALSPDGRFMAYVSNETGRAEVYVTGYPGPRGKWAVSIEGGSEPVWSRDGRALYYRNVGEMWAVTVESGDDFRASPPRLLFDAPFSLRLEQSEVTTPNYDVAADGRFLMLEPVAGSTLTRLHVVLNFFDELERLVPTDN